MTFNLLSLVENGVALVVAGFIIAMGLNIFGQVAGRPMHGLTNLGPMTLVILSFVSGLLTAWIGWRLQRRFQAVSIGIPVQPSIKERYS